MDTRKLDLNLLLALEALLAELNVTRAARRLNLSQPALSAQLARLRGVFKDQLLIPTSRGMLPTAMALELHEPLRQAIDQMRTIVTRSQAFDPATAEITFSIAASDYMQVAILLMFILKIQQTAPGVRVLVRLLDLRQTRSELERGDIDVAFVQTGDVEGPDVRSLDVLSERYVGIARRGTLGPEGMGMDRFLASRHIIVSPRAEGFHGPTDDALAAMGLKRSVGFAVSSFLFLLESVAQCDLIALAPLRLAQRYADRVDTFEPPLPVSGFTIAMVWHDRTHDHPGHVWLRRRLAEFCAEN